jgi:hypothetical protein
LSLKALIWSPPNLPPGTAAPLSSTLVATPLGNAQPPVASYPNAPPLPVQKESKQRDKSVLLAVPQDCDRALPVFTNVQQKKETLKLLLIAVGRQAVATDITMWSVAIHCH